MVGLKICDRNLNTLELSLSFQVKVAKYVICYFANIFRINLRNKLNHLNSTNILVNVLIPIPSPFIIARFQFARFLLTKLQFCTCNPGCSLSEKISWNKYCHTNFFAEIQ